MGTVHRTSRTAAAVVLALGGAGLGGPPAQAAAQRPPASAVGLSAGAGYLSAAPGATRPRRWREYVGQPVRWRPALCADDVKEFVEMIGDRVLRAECARVIAPLDWADLNKGSIVLQVTRVRRELRINDVRRTRTMFVNPGGPGVASGWFAASVAYVEPELHALHDIVAVDPRGTGLSTPLACSFRDDGLVDHRAPSRRRIAIQQSVLQQTVAACAKQAPTYLRQITTDNTIRDHDLVRSLIRAEKVDWLGVSAGTWMGAAYAQSFSARVGRFVLDGNTQFTTGWLDSFRWQPKGFQRRFEEQFLPWVARQHTTYRLGSTPAQVRAAYEAVRAAAGRGRLPGITPDVVDRYVIGGMYQDIAFPETASLLAGLWLETFTGRTVRRSAPPSVPLRALRSESPTWSSTEDTVMMAIMCNDSGTQHSPNALADDGLRLGRAYPLTGYQWVTSPCAYWPWRPKPTATRTGTGIPTMLMLQTELDPATPWEGASLVSRAHQAVRMLVVDNSGEHGAYLGENRCVESSVTRFFTTGVLPAEGARCAALPLPDETRVYEVGTRATSTGPGTGTRWAPVRTRAGAAVRAAIDERVALGMPNRLSPRPGGAEDAGRVGRRGAGVPRPGPRPVRVSERALR